MNQLKVFESPEFGRMRTISVNGDPWFVGKDVAAALGYKDTRSALQDHVESEDKRIFKSGDLPPLENHLPKEVIPVNFVRADIPNRGLTIINESGVYSLIFGSKLPKTKEFKHWVTSEVLPSIRRHGGYLTGQEELTHEELLAKSLLYAHSVMEERAARIEKLEAETRAQAEQLAIAEPKADYYDAFIHTKTSSNFRTTAKELDVGERRMINMLIEKGFLYRDKQGDLLPYSERNRGYFIVRDVATGHWMGKQTFITEKGKQHIRTLCRREWLIPGMTITS